MQPFGKNSDLHNQTPLQQKTRPKSSISKKTPATNSHSSYTKPQNAMNTHLITRYLGSLALGLVLTATTILPQPADAKTYRGVGFQVFYDELAPYGDWVKDARYGYIWLPAVRGDFHPYGTEGHWVMTEYGNTWVSYYDWGWAPFHYGRWYFDDYFRSWAWIPGYEWGPAWVNWRAGGGYYGWAPLGPGLSIQVNVSIPSFHWVFIPNRHIHHHYAYRYHAPHKTKVKIYNNTTVINNTVVYNSNNYVGGPQRREVEQVTKNAVPVYSVQTSNAPGRAAVSKNSVTLYKPQVQDNRGRNMEVKPSRVMDAQQAKTARSSRELNTSAPSRSSSPSSNSGGSAVGTSPRSSQSSGVSGGTSTPSRSANPSGNAENQKPVVKPMPAEVPNRSTTTAPSRPQSPGSRETAPARSPEVKKEGSGTQQPAPSRGTVQQSKPAQSPSRSQSPEVKRTEPAKSKASEPSKAQTGRSSTQAKQAAPVKKGPAETSGRTSGSGRSASSGGNN